ncbi:MAG: hypothetical protein ACE5IW_12525 [bacterium]
MAKLCAVCQDVFIPDPRVGKRQLVCQNLSCQQERKRRAQKRWLSQNPGYFTGRYPYVKEWLKAHPGYLKQYRARKKALLAPGSSDIQDELTYSKDYVLTALKNTLDIQDEITSKITTINKHLKALASLIYKTSEAAVFAGG